MFNIFGNKNEKIARRIAQTLLNHIHAAFYSAHGAPSQQKYINQNGKFSAPAGFFQDQYIIGYLYSMMSMALFFDFNGKNMSGEKSKEIHEMILALLSGSNFENALSAFGRCKEMLESGQAEKDFERGWIHGKTFMAYIYDVEGQIKERPLELEQAIQMPSQSITMSSPKEAVMLKFNELTLIKHIKENYLD